MRAFAGFEKRGTLKNGKDFYADLDGNCAVEQDHRDLVEATPEEMAEIAEILLTVRMETANALDSGVNRG